MAAGPRKANEKSVAANLQQFAIDQRGRNMKDYTADGLEIHTSPNGQRYVIERDGTKRLLATYMPNFDIGPTVRDERGRCYRPTLTPPARRYTECAPGQCA